MRVSSRRMRWLIPLVTTVLVVSLVLQPFLNKTPSLPVTTAPPVDVTVAVVIGVPFSNVRELGLYEIDGAISLTTIVTVAVSVPPVLVAVIV